MIKLTMALLLTVLFLFRLFLDFVALRSEKNEIPENVAELYDKDEFEKWKRYHGESIRLSVVRGIFSYLIDLVCLVCNLYAWFAGLFGGGAYMQTFAVVLFSELVSLLLLPFSWIDTMRIEQKYGFNRTTVKTFIADTVKNILLDLLLTGALGALLCALHLWLGPKMIFLFAGALILVVLSVSFLFPLFSRLFNKFTPLEDGELKEKLTALLEKNGYRVKGIEVMDASRRTTKMNAYFAGFGKTKTIVLYDNLVEKMSADDICAVFAHEMGHGLHRDTLKLQALNMLNMAAIALFVYLDVSIPAFCTGFGFEGINYGFVILLAFSIEASLWLALYGILTNFVTRRAEYRADAQAVKEGYGEALIHALKQLTKENLGNIAPSKITVILEYNHPTLSQRIAAIEKEMGR